MNADVRGLRLDGAERADDEARTAEPEPAGSAVMVARTTTVSSYPAAAQAYYGVVPQTVFGAEAEGAPGSVNDSPGAPIAYALNLGGAVPPVGTLVLCSHVGHRWVFRYDGT